MPAFATGPRLSNPSRAWREAFPCLPWGLFRLRSSRQRTDTAIAACPPALNTTNQPTDTATAACPPALNPTNQPIDTATSAPFSSLPAELIDKICSQLSQRDKLSLCMTNKRLNELAFPTLYKSVIITTSDVSRAESFILAAERYGHLVRELRIVISAAVCHIVDCKCCSAQSPRWKESFWSAHAGESALLLLRGDVDSMLPRLHHIAVEFPNRFGAHHRPKTREWSDYDICGNPCPGPEDGEEADPWFTIESGNLRRAHAAFKALAKRRNNTTVKRLTIANFPMCTLKDVPACTTRGWKLFLGGLERVEISLWAGEEGKNTVNGTRWAQWRNDHAIYTKFIDSLASFFFDYLASVKHLRLECSMHAAIGQNDNEITRRLPLTGKDSPKNTMPLLESLELAKIMVDQPLLDFLETRAGQPPLALTLENTWAYAWSGGRTSTDTLSRFEGGREDKPARRRRWAACLDDIRSMITREDGPRLRKFEMSPEKSFRYAWLSDPWPEYEWCCTPPCRPLFDAEHDWFENHEDDFDLEDELEAEEKLLEVVAQFNRDSE